MLLSSAGGLAMHVGSTSTNEPCSETPYCIATAGNDDAEQQQPADDDVLHLGVHVLQGQRSLETSEDEDGEEDSEDGAAPAEDGDAAEEHDGDDIELETG